MNKQKLIELNLKVSKAIVDLLLFNFIKYSCDYLLITKKPVINIIYDIDHAYNNKSFGYFNPNDNSISVVFANRSLADSFRTLSHELVHYKQNLDNRITNSVKDGETGSDIENEANSKSGIIMRNFGKKYPIIFIINNFKKT